MVDAPPLCFFDLETRSKVDLKKHGLHRYARDPSTEVVCISMSFKGGPNDGLYGVWAPEHLRSGLKIDDSLLEKWDTHVRDGGFVVAWNAQFDRTILDRARLDRAASTAPA